MEFMVDLEAALLNQNLTKPNGQFQLMIHFDFDFYQPWPMNDLVEMSEELEGNYQIWRMVPQGQYHYFLSYGNLVFTPSHNDCELVQITAMTQRHIQGQLEEDQHCMEIGINFTMPYLAVIDTIPMVAERLIKTMESSLPGSSVVPEVILAESKASHLE